MKFRSLKKYNWVFWYGISILGYLLHKMPEYLEGSSGFSLNVQKHIKKNPNNTYILSAKL